MLSIYRCAPHRFCHALVGRRRTLEGTGQLACRRNDATDAGDRRGTPTIHAARLSEAEFGTAALDALRRRFAGSGAQMRNAQTEAKSTVAWPFELCRRRRMHEVGGGPRWVHPGTVCLPPYSTSFVKPGCRDRQLSIRSAGTWTNIRAHQPFAAPLSAATFCTIFISPIFAHIFPPYLICTVLRQSRRLA